MALAPPAVEVPVGVVTGASEVLVAMTGVNERASLDWVIGELDTRLATVLSVVLLAGMGVTVNVSVPVSVVSAVAVEDDGTGLVDTAPLVEVPADDSVYMRLVSLLTLGTE